MLLVKKVSKRGKISYKELTQILDKFVLAIDVYKRVLYLNFIEELKKSPEEIYRQFSFEVPIENLLGNVRLENYTCIPGCTACCYKYSLEFSPSELRILTNILLSNIDHQLYKAWNKLKNVVEKCERILLPDGTIDEELRRRGVRSEQLGAFRRFILYSLLFYRLQGFTWDNCSKYALEDINNGKIKSLTKFLAHPCPFSIYGSLCLVHNEIHRPQACQIPCPMRYNLPFDKWKRELEEEMSEWEKIIERFGKYQ